VVTIAIVDGIATEQSPFIDAIPDTAEMRVHRTGNLDESLVVFYLVRGTAMNGKDYHLLRGELTIPAGAPGAPLIIDPIDDEETERVETVVVTVIPKEIAPDGQLGYYAVGVPDAATAEIRDNESGPNVPPQVAVISPPPGAVLPLASEIHVLAEARDPDGWVTSVEFFVDGESIGVATPVRWSTQSIEPADALEDPDWRPPHLFSVRWIGPRPGTHQLMASAEDNLGEKTKSDPVEVHLIEVPEPVVVQVHALDPEGAEGPLDDTLAAIPDPAVFLLSRSGPMDFPLEVFFELGGTAVNGMDYQEMPTSIVIPEGAHSVEVIVHPIDDLIQEPDESVGLRIIPPACLEIFPPPRECYLVGIPSAARAVIRDNDPVGNLPPRVRIINPPDGQVMAGPADLRLTAVAWDGDGTIESVEFFVGDRSLGIVTEPDPMPAPAEMDDDDPSLMLPRYSVSWPDVPPGHYTLTAMATDDDGVSRVSAPTRLWVVDTAELQIVSVEASDPEAAEPDDPSLGPDVLDIGRFTIRRTGPTGPLTVYYRLGGSARNGVDYHPLPHKTVIPAGETSVDLEVYPLHDRIAEGTEHVELRLLPVCCLVEDDATLAGPYAVGQPAAAHLAIHDNDANGNVPPRVKLSRPVEGQVFVGLQEIELVAMAQDPDGWVPAVEFYSGDRLIGTSEIVFVREPDPGLPQIFSFVWKDVPPGRHTLTVRAIDDHGAASTSGPVNISVLHSEILPVVTVEATDPRASEGGTLAVIDPAIFTVHRRGDLTSPLLVFYTLRGTAMNGEDYLALSGSVEIPAEAASVTIEVVPLADQLEEGVETVIVRLEPMPCPAIFPPPPGCYMVGEPSWAIAGIVDGPESGNLPPRVEIVRPFPEAVYHAPANIAVVAQARDRDGYVTLVELFANEVKIGEVSVNFLVPPPPGELQTFEFTWREVPPGDYLLTARATDELGAVSNMSTPFSVVVLPADDVPVVTLFAADPLASETPNADGTIDTATFKVRRSGRLDQSLTVFFDLRGTAESGADYAALDQQVVIPAGSRWARITVMPLADGMVEDPETVVLEVMPSPTMGPIESYRVGSPKLAAALILDHENPAVPVARVRNWLHLQIPCESGAPYRVEVSENLRDWQALTDGWADDTGMHHIETSTDQFPRRFYRLLPLAPEAIDDTMTGERGW
jgi:hypothetical protein